MKNATKAISIDVRPCLGSNAHEVVLFILLIAAMLVSAQARSRSAGRVSKVDGVPMGM